MTTKIIPDMNCPNPNCNTTGLPEDAKFCPNCGCNIIDVLYQNERQKQREEEAKIECLRIQKEKEDYLRKREEERKEKEKEEKKALLLLKHKNTIVNLEKIDEGAIDICHRRYNFNLFINVIVGISPIGLIFLAVMIWNHLDLWDLWGWWFAVIVILLCLISFLIVLRSDQFIFTRKKVTQELISYYEQKINNEKINEQLKDRLRTAINGFCDEIVTHYCRDSEISYVYGNNSNNSYYLRDTYINLLFEQL